MVYLYITFRLHLMSFLDEKDPKAGFAQRWMLETDPMGGTSLVQETCARCPVI